MYDLSRLNWNIIFQYCFHIDECWNTFVEILNSLCFKYMPIRNRCKSNRTACSKFNKRRYPQYIVKLIKFKLLAWKRLKQNSNEHNKCVYIDARKNCTNAIYKFNSAKELELIRKNNLNKFYNFVNNKISS